MSAVMKPKPSKRQAVLKDKTAHLSVVPNDGLTSGMKIDYNKYEAAGFWARFAAMLVDGLILGFVTYPLQMINTKIMNETVAAAQAMSPGEEALGSLVLSQTMTVLGVGLLVFAVYVVYDIYFLTQKNGQTPGRMFFKIRLISLKDEEVKLSAWQVVSREFFVKPVSFMLMGFGIFMMLFNHQKRTLHDYALKTRVIKC